MWGTRYKELQEHTEAVKAAQNIALPGSWWQLQEFEEAEERSKLHCRNCYNWGPA